MFSRLLLGAYFIEAGLVLLIAPWTRLWERNYFLASWDVVNTLLMNPWLRGAVSGVGVVTLAAGLLDLFSLLSRRAAARAGSAGTPN